MDGNGLVSFIDSCKLIREEAHKFKYPFLLMTGELDEVVCKKECDEWFKNCTHLQPEQKEKAHFAGIGHELHKDRQRNKVFIKVF